MKYSLEIIQKSDGESSTVAVDANGERYDDVLILHYIFDSAEYSLEIRDSQMAQNRFGAIRLSTRFTEGRTIAAHFDDGTNGGEFPVYTRKLDIKFDGADCRVNCEFSYGECGETVNLSVNASVLQ